MSDNLLKAENLTSSELRERARKGGIASGKARREKKAMKETLITLLGMSMKDGKESNIEKIQSFASLKGENITVQDAMMIAQVQKALKGDTTAFAAIRDTIGEKPIIKQDVSINESPKLADVISQLGGSGLSDDE